MYIGLKSFSLGKYLNCKLIDEHIWLGVERVHSLGNTVQVYEPNRMYSNSLSNLGASQNRMNHKYV